MQTQFLAAINQICDEKNIPKEVVIKTVEDALAAAYKKDYGHKEQEVRVELDPKTGNTRVFVIKEVVEKEEDVENNYLQISLAEAKKIRKEVKVGETVEIENFPKDFGRIAAQTAKQVIIQRIREAERDIVFAEYKDKEGELINAVVQRIEGSTVIVDLGRASGVLFANEQVPGERYYVGQRLKVYIVKVEQTAKGPQVVISRSHPGVVRRLFELEVPEIESGIVEIKTIAREAGHRTKIAVSSNEENVDPVGSCVGQRGIRVQAVIAELGEEKIDVILWDEDPEVFITNALSPAKVININTEEKEKKATVKVQEDQLSLAIGKQGQNVRLAAKLTGWNVDIKGSDESGIAATEGAIEGGEEEKKDLEEEVLKAVEKGVAEEEVRTEEPIEEIPVEEAESKEPAKLSEESSAGKKEKTASDTASAASDTINQEEQKEAEKILTKENQEKIEDTAVKEVAPDEIEEILEEEAKAAASNAAKTLSEEARAASDAASPEEKTIKAKPKSETAKDPEEEKETEKK